MSTNIIFTVPGRTANYMPVDVNTSKEVLLEKYARESYSTENTWPYESPSAGYYDITNSDTKLILLNKRITWSHLRGKTKAKREPFIKDEYYDWVEKEIEMKAQNEKNSNSSRGQSATKRTADPSRHFSAIGCTFKPDFKDESSNSIRNKNISKSYNWTRPRTGVSESKNNKELKKDDQDELIRYFYEMSTRKAGLFDKTHVKNPPYEYLSSYNINHPELSKGQKMFLNNLCSVYSVSPLKKSKQNQYLTLLDRQKAIDKYSRDKFRMHDGENFDMYREFIKTARHVPNLINCGYFNPKPVKSAYAGKSTSKKVLNSNYDSNRKNDDNNKSFTGFDSTSLSSSTNSTTTYSTSSNDSNPKSANDKSKGNVLSDLSNTDYESSSESSSSSSSSSISSKSKSSSSTSHNSNEDNQSETSRSLSQISHLSDGYNTKTSSSSSSSRTLTKLTFEEEDSDLDDDEKSDRQSKSSRPSSSSSTLSTDRSEFMNSSRKPTAKLNAPSNKKSKPIQIIQKPEEEEE
ncbi:unnamed protein product [Brachionus calyciflorus]|uniref:Uncharacterized protein n=1 Tax=Brachionus calyciflorus TaxID=104777 RepID=A0A813UMZ1_9BILA|nr:unnamed protein product [Brachionus calyciflorus]